MGNEWAIGTLDQLIDFKPKRTIRKNSLAPFVAMADIANNSRAITNIGTREYKGGGSRFLNGDTLFARITPCLENGKTAKVFGLPDGTVAHGSTEFIVMAARHPDYDQDYIYYLARLPEFRKYAEARMEGTSGRQRVSWQALSSYELTIPPKAQRKYIGTLLGSLDDRIELNRRMNATLEAMAQALFKSWFVDFDPVIDNALAGGKEIHEELSEKAKVRAALGDKRRPLPEEIRTLFPDEFAYSGELGWIPKGWEVTTLKNGIELFDSKRIPLNKRQREEKKGPIPYYGAASIMDYVDDYLFDGVYILVGEDGTVQTDTGNPVLQYVWGKFWVNNHAHVCLGKNSISAEHLYLLLQNVNIVPFVTGAVQPKLNQKNLMSIPLILAPPEVNDAFKDVVDALFGKIRANADSVNQLAKLRDTLLPKLLSGELRIPDAEKMVKELAL